MVCDAWMTWMCKLTRFDLNINRMNTPRQLPSGLVHFTRCGPYCPFFNDEYMSIDAFVDKEAEGVAGVEEPR